MIWLIGIAVFIVVVAWANMTHIYPWEHWDE
ncbi:hypothetical protein DNAM_270 [Pseudomonas phage BroderSalsa]|nr:hypothetical protein DNAM_270 [Pseudomonas phage BroderSalsa]